ncbi:U-box domain-containing protein 26 [Dendrobium catenatum]|uniref:U-box domain-containing protein n=1 Tax=Dendrobium catenatum TaxID=906689 RepID=A0A2I0W4G3_9ASPA|nr:U-box domain-containing protein 26 [Dendrobium catenatum]PKU70555.1 U-box domain-containing protein 25 [Dendrobium catenatum]
MRGEVRARRLRDTPAPPLDLVGVQIPYHFRCPISLELMRDPVTVSTGQTYDRPSIESWFAMGNTTCPVTRCPLPDFTVIPNHTLRRLIQEWCVAHRSDGVERIPTPKQPADPTLVRLLLAQASAGDASLSSRIAALRRLRALACESEKNRAVVSTYTRSAIAEMAFGADLDLAVGAMEALAAVGVTERESAMVAARPERVAMLAGMIRLESSAEARIGAAALVEGMRTAEAREAVGAADGVIEGLVALVENGDSRAVRAGMRGLFSLCLAKENRGRAVMAGAAEAVVRRIGEMYCVERGDLERALATVELLCRVEGGREAVVGVEGAVADLVRAMTGKATERAAEHAAGALVAVVGGSEALQEEAVAAGVVTQLLLMVQSGCSDRARRKAQMLLKILRPAWPMQDLFANSDDFLHPF